MNKDAPLVNVIIVNYNGRAYLDACLQSLRGQRFRDFSISVVDNGSSDGSVRFLEEKYAEVNVVKLEENVGFARANNVGIRWTSGKYVALLNNDTEADPAWLEELVKAIETDERADLCASKLLLQGEEDRLDTAGDFYSVAGAGGKIGHLENSDEPKYEKKKEVFGACAGAAIYRRKVLDDIGLFDECFFLTQEDVDLSYRARLNGYNCLYVPSAEVEHRVHGSIGEYSDSYVYYGQRNLEYVYVKNTPASLLAVTLLPHLVDNFFSFLFYLSLGKGMAFLRAKKDAIFSLPELLESRKKIQEDRSVSALQIFRSLRKDWPFYRLKSLVKKVKKILSSS